MGSLRQQIGERANPIRWCHSLLLVTAMSTGAVAGGCSSDSDVATGPTQLKCQVALAAPSSSIGPDGGTGTITVTTSPECPWDVSTGATLALRSVAYLGTRHAARWSFVRRPIPCLQCERAKSSSTRTACGCRSRRRPAEWSSGQAASPSMPQGVPERSRCRRRAAVHGPPRRTRVGSRSRRRSHEAETGAWVSASRQIAAVGAAWARSSWGTSGSPSRRSQQRQHQGACI